jgi:hypothetical protein
LPISFADVEQAAKEGFKGVPEGMKKIARAIEGSEEVDKKAKQHWKAMDKLAKKTWKKAGEDIKKKTKD